MFTYLTSLFPLLMCVCVYCWDFLDLCAKEGSGGGEEPTAVETDGTIY